MNALVDYEDSPLPAGADGYGEAAPAAAGPSSEREPPSILPGLLSLMVYHDDEAKGAQPPAPEVRQKTRELLGVSLDHDDVLGGGSRKVGSVQVSITKRTRPATGDDEVSAAAAAAAVPEVLKGPAFEIPPSPPMDAVTEVVEKYRGFVQKAHEGQCVNDYIRYSKNFRNPDHLEKLVAYMDVLENGTNYPPERYDPSECSRHPLPV